MSCWGHCLPCGGKGGFPGGQVHPPHKGLPPEPGKEAVLFLHFLFPAYFRSSKDVTWGKDSRQSASGAVHSCWGRKAWALGCWQAPRPHLPWAACLHRHGHAGPGVWVCPCQPSLPAPAPLLRPWEPGAGPPPMGRSGCRGRREATAQPGACWPCCGHFWAARSSGGRSPHTRAGRTPSPVPVEVGKGTKAGRGKGQAVAERRLQVPLEHSRHAGGVPAHPADRCVRPRLLQFWEGPGDFSCDGSMSGDFGGEGKGPVLTCPSSHISSGGMLSPEPSCLSCSQWERTPGPQVGHSSGRPAEVTKLPTQPAVSTSSLSHCLLEDGWPCWGSGVGQGLGLASARGRS